MLMIDTSVVNLLYPVPVSLQTRATLVLMSKWRFTWGEIHLDQVLLTQAGQNILNYSESPLSHVFIISAGESLAVFATHLRNDWRQKARVNNWIKVINTHTVICKHVTKITRIHIEDLSSSDVCITFTGNMGSWTALFPVAESLGWSCRITPVGDLIALQLMFELQFFPYMYPFVSILLSKKRLWILSFWDNQK